MVAAGDVRTSLIFLKPDEKHQHEKPYRLRYDPGEAIPRTNCETQEQTNILVHDIRGAEENFTLDTHGFQVLKLESALLPEEFYDRERVKGVYYEELKELLKKTFGAERAEVLEHGVCTEKNSYSYIIYFSFKNECDGRGVV